MKFLILIFLLSVSPSIGDQKLRDKCVKKVNENRRAFAKRANISNMNEMEYDMGLEKKIITEKITCNTSPPLATISNGHDLLEVDGTFGGIASQEKIACVKTKCMGEPIVQLLIGEVEWQVLQGPPGSACSSGRVHKDGLCVKGSTGFSRIILPIFIAIFYL